MHGFGGARGFDGACSIRIYSGMDLDLCEFNGCAIADIGEEAGLPASFGQNSSTTTPRASCCPCSGIFANYLSETPAKHKTSDPA
mmetsp:Transcript_181783/g.576926  ORF Transcript_181783/g.576926 Transcript_181783/m.576926 type:complete len:85 (-) Transcript_181783:28-282(-)